MSTRPATLVLSGGGAKGAFQVGAEQVLREQGGFTWERVFGVSVGALNGALIAQAAYGLLAEVWRSIKEQDIYKKAGWLKVAWRIAIQHKTGLYDGSPLKKTIDKYVTGRPFKVPFHAGRVSLTSGQYELVASTAADIYDAIWHSATMPVIWEPIGPKAYVDGGLRNVTPLGDALRFHCTEVVVITCDPAEITEAARPRDILAALVRSLTEITINEIFRNDLREFVRINRLVTQAAAKGVALADHTGAAYRHCPITIFHPTQHLGDTLDFSRATTEWRLQAGRVAVFEWLAREKGSGVGPPASGVVA